MHLGFCSFWTVSAAWFLQAGPGGDQFVFSANGRYENPMSVNDAWKSASNGAKYMVDFVKVEHSSGDASKEAFAFRYHKMSYLEPKYKDMDSSGIFEEVEHEYKVSGRKVYGRSRMFRKGEMKEIFENRLCYAQGFWTQNVLDYVIGNA